MKGIEPSQPAWKAGVLPLNYTRNIPRAFTPFCCTNYFEWWRGKDSNLRRPKSTGLQPAPFDRFGTPPTFRGNPLYSKKLLTTGVLYSRSAINAISDFKAKSVILLDKINI